ncbi:sulfurtransferase TusA family protein [Vibrio neonatus]|uniref:sulfurtransferase TusA family protein n=1 Tax=Vibrio neonatus TaxID=278860 RepID=UPI0021C2E4BB|nr:sulfurtransferase TusA family protein [Vibrio neonatus]
MSVEIIDLTEERCPMTLLLAKRASRALLSSQSLTFLVLDLVSINDMQAYFLRHGMQVDVKQATDFYSLTITKE